MRLAEYYTKTPSIVTRPFEKLLYLLPESKKERDYVRWGRMFVEATRLPPDERYYNMIRYFSEKEKEELYSESFKKSHKFKDSSYFVKELFNRARTNDYEKKTFYAEINSFLPYNLLEYGDKTSMAASLEARVPFVDHKLIEFSATIPYSIKLKRFQLKYVLKMAMKPYLPKFVLKRKKWASIHRPGSG
nr:asparagine synthase-related protein [Thermococcus sibiricus]